MVLLRFILEGRIISEFKAIFVKENMKHAPTVITQMKPLAHVSSLLQSLIGGNICNKKGDSQNVFPTQIYKLFH